MAAQPPDLPRAARAVADLAQAAGEYGQARPTSAPSASGGVEGLATLLAQVRDSLATARYDQAADLMERYQGFRGTLAQGPEQLLAACRLSDELGQLVYRVYQYPGLMQAQDTRDNAVQARLEEVRIALARFKQASAWYAPELLAIPHETMIRWLCDMPELAPYRFPIEDPTGSRARARRGR
jgi:oligoendopeptidase F